MGLIAHHGATFNIPCGLCSGDVNADVKMLLICVRIASMPKI
jgi:hypothetical protein